MSEIACVTEVWDIDLTAHAPDWERYSSLLEEDERLRAGRFVSLELRQKYAVTRGVLRILAGQKLHCSPREIQFAYSIHGKPSIANGGGLHFNVSHSGSRAAMAFSSAEVGVDIERVRPFSEPMNLVRRFFSKQELQAFEKVGAEEQQTLFFRCWTRKEAFVKALGQGLALGLETFTVPLSEDCSERPLIEDPRHPGRWWQVVPLTMEDGYAGAVVVDPGAAKIRKCAWKGFDL